VGLCGPIILEEKTTTIANIIANAITKKTGIYCSIILDYIVFSFEFNYLNYLIIV
jgi:hypothetical protein